MTKVNSFEYYKKPAKTPLFVHHQSALPRNSKINFIRNERRRIQRKCSTQTTLDKQGHEFDNILRLNGCPEDAIDESKLPQNRPRDLHSQNTEWLCLKIPFFSDRDVLAFWSSVFGLVERPSVQAVSHLSFSQALRSFGAPNRGFPAFLVPSNCLNTAKLRRATTRPRCLQPIC